jgi:putative NIF3 family GTP cyclohydrolase 1 type 2
VAAGLPPTSWGVRAAGDPEREIRTVAVCGGAGDSALDAAVAAGVDAYVTADLRHHPASEHLLAGSLPARATPALIDVAHWASEWPWCQQAADVVDAALGGSVEVRVSRRRTDPWTVAPSAGRTQ